MNTTHTKTVSARTLPAPIPAPIPSLLTPTPVPQHRPQTIGEAAVHLPHLFKCPPPSACVEKHDAATKDKAMKAYQQMSKIDLVDLCVRRNVDTRGTKFDMARRLYNQDKPGIMNKIFHSRPVFYLENHPCGDWIHDETRFIIDKKTRRVKGRVDPLTNEMRELTYDDCVECKELKLLFDLPENLYASTGPPPPPCEERERLRRRLEEIEKNMHDDRHGQGTQKSLMWSDDDEEDDGDDAFSGIP